MFVSYEPGAGPFKHELPNVHVPNIDVTDLYLSFVQDGRVYGHDGGRPVRMLWRSAVESATFVVAEVSFLLFKSVMKKFKKMYVTLIS